MSNTWTPFAAWLCSWGGHTTATSLLWDRAVVRSWWPILCKWSEHQRGPQGQCCRHLPSAGLLASRDPPQPPTSSPFLCFDGEFLC